MLLRKKTVTLSAAFPSFFSLAAADLNEYTNPDGRTIWDEAPNFKNNPIQPYPDLRGSNGEYLTIENLRGVHLFGWKGCSGEESKWIKEAYNDFYKLAKQPELYNNIDWNDRVYTHSLSDTSVILLHLSHRSNVEGLFTTADFNKWTGDHRFLWPEYEQLQNTR